MKTIKVKSKLTEAKFTYNGDEETVNKIKKRQARILRTADQARQAAADARKNGDDKIADELDSKAAELEALANLDKAKQDTFGDDLELSDDQPDEPTNPQEPPSDPDEPPEDELEFEKLKRELRRLKDGAKAGAGAAIADILKARASKTESFQEDLDTTKDITELSDDEVEDIINQTINLINKVKPVKVSTDLSARIKEIQKDNTSTLLNRELDAEDRLNTAEERANLRASKKELERYRDRQAQGTSAFQNMLRLSIANQVKAIEDEEDSWGALNRRTQGTTIIKPGTIIDDKKKKALVTIQVYVDCSTSFNASDIKKELGLLSVLDKYVQQGKVGIDLWYASVGIYRSFEPARKAGGNSWDPIINNIKKTRPTNVLIITDSDMNWSCRGLGATHTVPGCAWYIWKYNDAPELPKHVSGRRGTYEYWLE